MSVALSALLITLWLAFGTDAALAAVHFDFAHDASLSTEETRLTKEAVEQISELLSTWSYKQNLSGRYEIVFINSRALPEMEPWAETAVFGNAGGHPTLILAWDRIDEMARVPMLTSFEHIAAHLYIASQTGDAFVVEPELAKHLTSEGVFRALTDVRRAVDTFDMPDIVKAQIDEEWRQHLQTAYPKLSKDEIARFDCNSTLEGPRRIN